MSTVLAPSELSLQSIDRGWNRERWELLDHRDGKRYEVIDGVLYVSTSPSFFHQWIVGEVYAALRSQIMERNLGWVATSPVGLFMPGCDPVQPDVVVILREQRELLHDKHIFGVPALIVEVVSPSHPELDTRIKRAAYARAGLPEYWLLRPASRDALICSQPDATLGDFGHTDLLTGDAELRSPTLPVQLRVSDLFAGAPDTSL